ncbi:DNA polymerase III subunit gamma/tau [Candidatus Saccharibacteria bacterium]|nr:DNA polymerase III subunit gamma/tau [Candidatus Saccharibacteria bacterium]
MKSLYRRYRPVRLEEVVGQEQVTGPLANSLKAGKINHSYLFIGPRGCGKTSVARILAHEINGFEYQIEDDYVDIIEIDGASNRGIENIRELREKVLIAPTTGKYKVYIIDEVHMLTKEAFNALLKTLEEPPAHAVFIMATTDAYKVPITITSRSQTFTFKLAEPDVMLSHLKTISEKESIKIEDAALKMIVKRGGGSFRDSLSLLDQISTLSDEMITEKMVVSALGLPEEEKIDLLIEDYLRGDSSRISEALKELLSSGIKAEVLAEELIRRIMEKPQRELMTLLMKLPEVKAPYSEAKLLVALLYDYAASPISQAKAPTPARNAGVSSVRQAIKKPAVAPPSGSSDGGPAEPTHEAAMSNAKSNEPNDNSASGNEVFDWDSFISKVQELNDAVYSQAVKCKYSYSGGELSLFPAKKIVKTILSRDNNKRILVQAANGVKITIREPGETPDGITKDETLSKISDIMGGEVTNDGGTNPF